MSAFDKNTEVDYSSGGFSQWGFEQDMLFSRTTTAILEETKPRISVATQTSKQFNIPQIGILGAYIAIFCCAYVAALTQSYGFTDDYTMLHDAQTDSLFANSFSIFAGGRPIYALWLQVVMPLVNNVESLRYVRFFGIIGIALLAWCLYRFAQAKGVDQKIAFLLPIFICSLPAYQVFASWAITALFPYSGILAGLGAILGSRALADGKVKKTTWLLGLACLMASIFIYQPTAMLFWVFAAFSLFGEKRRLKDMLYEFGGLLIMMGTAFIGDFVASKVLPGLIYGNHEALTRASVTTDVGSKFLFFLQPLLESANLFHLVEKQYLAVSFIIGISVITIIITGLMRFFNGDLRTRLIKVGLALLCFPLAYLPNLLVAESWGSFRSQVGLSSLMVVFFIFAIIGLVRTPMVMEGLIFTLVGLSAFFASSHETADLAVPQAIEYHVMVAQLRAVDFNQVTTVYVVPASMNQWLSNEAHHDEYGVPSSSIPFAVAPMTELALQDAAPNVHPTIQIVAEPPTSVQPADFVLDMRIVQNYR